MRCGRVRLTLFFPLHNSNFLYQIENVVCYPFRTAILVDNGTIEGQIGEGCGGKGLGSSLSGFKPSRLWYQSKARIIRSVIEQLYRDLGHPEE